MSGLGIYLPANIVSNDDLSKTLDTNDEWISSRTGIKTRRIASPEETTITMSWGAVQDLQKNTSLEGVDLIICSTVTNEMRFPSVAARIQQKLGIPNIPTFDAPVGCAGLMYILSMARAYVKSGAAKKVLCIVAEKLSSIMDWTDRNTCVLFGDAAAALIVEDAPDTHEILECFIGGDGVFGDLLTCPVDPNQGLTYMDGAGVFKNAIRIMEQEIRRTCSALNMPIEKIDLLVPHQANLRIITAVGEKLGLPLEKTMINVDKYANTSCVSIPLALKDALAQGRLKKGDTLALAAIGAGFAWGAAIVRW